MPDAFDSTERFFYWATYKAEGPFNIIELAGLLKCATIDGDTAIRREGAEEWGAFRDLPEFAGAQEISIEAIARHLEEKTRRELASCLPRKTASFPWTPAAIALFLLSVTGLALIFSHVEDAGPMPGAAQATVPAAATFAFPQEYHVEMIFTAKNGFSVTNEVFVDNGKTRTDINLQSAYMIAIARPDQGKSYTLNVDTKTGTQRPFDASKAQMGVTGSNAKFEPIGFEVIRGISCTKYKVTNNGKAWFLWVDTARQAPVQLVPENGENGVITITYKNYQVGPQDPALFELPAGYHLTLLKS